MTLTQKDLRLLIQGHSKANSRGGLKPREGDSKAQKVHHVNHVLSSTSARLIRSVRENKGLGNFLVGKALVRQAWESEFHSLHIKS